MKHAAESAGVSRDLIHRALVAEGVPFLSNRYQNLHMLPMFIHKQCYGQDGFPWSMNADAEYVYGEGQCPVAERLNNQEFLGLFMCGSQFTDEETNLIGDAFHKVYANLSQLK